MKNLIWMGAATLSVMMGAAACTGGEDDLGLGGAGGMGSGGKASGGASTGGQGTGGTATGGGSSGGMGGVDVGGMGGMGGNGTGGTTEPPTLAEACEDRCATTTSVTCSGSQNAASCEAQCVNGSQEGCEDEYYAWTYCESQTEASNWQCFTQGPFPMVVPGLTYPCYDERQELWDCEDAL